ncbi:MAG TPA: hypothetical protein VFK05_17415 [Polyangiaceae bacterium]|nr:hypothetical protein [Polyangiaceae bacterium]
MASRIESKKSRRLQLLETSKWAGMLLPLVSLSIGACSASDNGTQEGSTPREGLSISSPTAEVTCGGGEGGATATAGAGAGGVVAVAGAGAGGTSDVGGAGVGGTVQVAGAAGVSSQAGAGAGGTAGAAGAATAGAGAGGTAGAAGAATAGAGAGGTAGAAGAGGSGGPCAGLCSPPKNITWSGSYQSGQIGTGAVCLQTTMVVHGGNCGNFISPRSLTVNGQSRPCNNLNWATIPPARNGGYCVQTTAGNQPWAFITLW